MRRTEHLGARALTVIGLMAALGYLVWRAAFSMRDTSLWLSIPTFAVEAVGYAGAALLAWALWPSPSRSTVRPHRSGLPDDRRPAVDLVVRVCQEPEHEVRATLLASKSVRDVAHLVVVDLAARPAIASLANEFNAVYAATDADDRNGIGVMAAAVQSPHFVLVDAGDTPTPDIVERLRVELADTAVAVVQGLGATLALDSAEHTSSGRHELEFERSSLNPALGRRGAAVWMGSGSLVRTDALRDAHIDNAEPLPAHWSAGAALMSAGWRIVAPCDAVVIAHRPVDDDSAFASDRAQRARAARRMIVGRSGVLRSPSFSPAQRLAVLAWAVRPLSGLRRIAFVAVLVAVLVTGSLPFQPNTFALLAGWLPAFVYTSVGLGLMSGWALRPGDRARWSLHTIGSPVVQPSTGLVMTVVVLSSAMVFRGLSDRFWHTLGELPQPVLMGVLSVALWTLALSLDVLRVLARRNQMRRTARVVSSIAATLGERAVSIVDLAAQGAGLVSQTGADVNERMLLDSAVSTRTGVTTMRVSCVVRNSTLLSDGDYRIGVEFGDVDVATANALAEYCTIEPMWEQLGALPDHSVTDPRRLVYVEQSASDRPASRLAVRLVSLLAVVGAVASSAPDTASASTIAHHRLSGFVMTPSTPEPEPTVPDTTVPDTTVPDTTVPDSTVPDTTVPDTTVAEGVAGVVVTAICSLDAGFDGQWGTADDAWGAPVSVSTDLDGKYELELDGEACWAGVTPPPGYDQQDDQQDGEQGAEPQPVDVSGDSAEHDVVVHRTDAVPGRGSVDGVASSALGNKVWNDRDGDGLQDRDEPGVAGVTVSLFDSRGLHLRDTISDATGRFGFNGLVAGGYRIAAANLPPGAVLTSTARGNAGQLDSDADQVTGRSNMVMLETGEHFADLDIGIVTRATADEQRRLADGPTFDAPALPAPDSSQVTAGPASRSTLAMVVLALAGLLALSILLGLARPRMLRSSESAG